MQNTQTPFIPAHKKIPELTFGPLLLGTLLGIVFGASSLYLTLKVGITVSASIPVAVLSITLLRAISKMFKVRQATILENNIVQTAGSAGESIAFGVAVTMPALMILGFEIDLSRVLIVGVLGAVLGILIMIPLRRQLIASNDPTLIYPEGRACAEVLIAGEKGGTSAKTVLGGFFAGLVHKFGTEGFKLWPASPEKGLSILPGATVASDMAAELMGVGYIIGPKTSFITVAGGVLSWLVLIPAIKLFGSHQSAPLFPATKMIAEMSAWEIWKAYVLYIGAGAVAAAGIVSLFRALPTLIGGVAKGLKSASQNNLGSKSSDRGLRTDLDLPKWFVFGGIVLLVLVIALVPTLHVNALGAFLIVAFGALFVMVSSRLTGEIGSSSNPVSGMTVATLLLTSLIFWALGWTSPTDRVAALTIAAIVCVAISNGGTTSQDLKTGQLVGGTPRLQQIAIIIGSVVSALVIGYTLQLLNEAKTIYAKRDFPSVVITAEELSGHRQKLHGPEAKNDDKEYGVLQLREARGEISAGKYLVDESGHIKYLVDPGINGTLKARDDGTVVDKYETPKARLMSLIIDGILTQKLPWGLVLLGAFIVLVLELCGVSALAFAVGVYLPISSSMPIFFGGVVRWLVDFWNAKKDGIKESESDSGPGVLFSSGLIAGASIAGVLLAFANFKDGLVDAMDFSKTFASLSSSDGFALIVFFVLACLMYGVGRRKLMKG